MADCPHGAAVRERLVDGEVEAGVGRLQTRPVERAAALRHLSTATRRTTERRPVRAFLEEEQLDSRIRRGFQRLLPPRRGLGHQLEAE